MSSPPDWRSILNSEPAVNRSMRPNAYLSVAFINNPAWKASKSPSMFFSDSHRGATQCSGWRIALFLQGNAEGFQKLLILLRQAGIKVYRCYLTAFLLSGFFRTSLEANCRLKDQQDIITFALDRMDDFGN